MTPSEVLLDGVAVIERNYISAGLTHSGAFLSQQGKCVFSKVKPQLMSVNTLLDKNMNSRNNYIYYWSSTNVDF